MLFRKLSFYLAIAGIVGTILMVKHLRQKPPTPEPVVEPSRSPFPQSVAASGMIEALRDNVKVAVLRPGLIQKIYVSVGSQVKKGDPLLTLDDRETRARIVTSEAQVAALQAQLAADKILSADAQDQFGRVEKLEKERVASEDERTRKKFLLENSLARAAKVDADLTAARAAAEEARVELATLTITAPRDGVILQLNVREGEHAALAPTEPLMILGDTEKLQVRADVDEQDAPLVVPNQKAVAFLKGDTKNPMPLRFIRIEPFVVPKRSLTGDTAERVDTRVLQIIFEMDRPKTPIYVGQQVDVFVESPVRRDTEGLLKP